MDSLMQRMSEVNQESAQKIGELQQNFRMSSIPSEPTKKLNSFYGSECRMFWKEPWQYQINIKKTKTKQKKLVVMNDLYIRYAEL